MLDHLGNSLCSAVAAAVVALSTGLAGQSSSPSKGSAGVSDPKVVRVLFVGNSLTAGNDLPSVVQAMARTEGIRFVYRAITPGGVSLEDQWQRGQARKLLSSAHWDFLVLQQGPSSRPESRENLREWSTRWADLARAQGTTPALYMVWPIQGQADGFQLVSQSYRQAAIASRSRLLPAGEAWQAAVRSDPTIALYTADGLHPTSAGTYLAALVITRGLTGLKLDDIPSKLTLSNGKVLQLPDAQAKALQRLAKDLRGS
jgi:hypothetical protein